MYGGAHFVDNFGPAGLVVVFGTAIPPDEGEVVAEQPAMTQISIFEPESGTWYNQTAAGPNSPAWRADFCTTGVAGDNGTYEM